MKSFCGAHVTYEPVETVEQYTTIIVVIVIIITTDKNKLTYFNHT